MATLDEALKDAYARNPVSQVYYETLELRHPAISEPLYMVKGHQNVTATLEDATEVTFVAVPFDLVLPETSDGGLHALSLTVDDVNKRASAFCRMAAQFEEPLEVYYRPYLPSDLSAPKMIPPLRLFLKGATITVGQVSGEATPPDFRNMPFPNQLYNRERFPALGDL